MGCCSFREPAKLEKRLRVLLIWPKWEKLLRQQKPLQMLRSVPCREHQTETTCPRLTRKVHIQP